MDKDKLDEAVLHINVSVPRPISRNDMIVSIKKGVVNPEWSYHVQAFFHETPIFLMHSIVLSGVFTFKELYEAHKKWDSKGYADGETTEWIKEMHYLSMGKAHELGIERFI